jgi:hypothetical protein
MTAEEKNMPEEQQDFRQQQHVGEHSSQETILAGWRVYCKGADPSRAPGTENDKAPLTASE